MKKSETRKNIKSDENELFKISIVRLEEDLDPDDYILKKGEEKIKYHLKHESNIFISFNSFICFR